MIWWNKRLHTGFGLLDRDAGFEASEHVDPALAPVVHGVETRPDRAGHRHRDTDLVRQPRLHAVEAALRYADDCQRIVVHAEWFFR